ncbi:MAG: CoA transferase, partial [Acidimicrobiales bacterium]
FQEGQTPGERAALPRELLDDGKVVVARQEEDSQLHGRLRHLPFTGAIDAYGLLGQVPYPCVSLDAGALVLDRQPALDWAASGAMALTGDEDGPALFPGGRQTAYLRGAALAARLLSTLLLSRNGLPPSGSGRLDGPALLGERAALAGLHRRGRVSPGGGCHLIEAADGWVAVSLTRPEDLELLGAWLGPEMLLDAEVDHWVGTERALRYMDAAEAVGRAQLLGLPVAKLETPAHAFDDEQARARSQSFPPSPFVIDGQPARAGCGRIFRDMDELRLARPTRPVGSSPVVVDLSSLWAGPLATSLLVSSGVRVLKVESHSRPDGARRGPRRFLDLLNAGKQCVAFDFDSRPGRDRLRALIQAADLVVDSSRPRAMECLGLAPETLLAAGAGPGGWLGITGYGRSGPWRQRAALGDDAAVGGGAVAWTPSRQPVLCADAYADPVTGLHAAVAAMAQLLSRGGNLVDLAMREVVGHMLWDSPGGPEPGPVAPEPNQVRPPKARDAQGRARPVGADTRSVLQDLGIG